MRRCRYCHQDLSRVSSPGGGSSSEIGAPSSDDVSEDDPIPDSSSASADVGYACPEWADEADDLDLDPDPEDAEDRDREYGKFASSAAPTHSHPSNSHWLFLLSTRKCCMSSLSDLSIISDR